jgi:hypothetical protein
MKQKQTTQNFPQLAIINDRLVAGTVSFSPAPAPGILSELADFEAQRIFRHLIEEEIEAGRL